MMEDREIRLSALWRDDRLEAKITVDLRIDSEARVVSHWDVFGAFDLDGAQCRPFVLRRNGVIDCGLGAERFWRTDLRDAKIRVGSRFTIFWNDADCGEYEIVKVESLGAKALTQDGSI